MCSCQYSINSSIFKANISVKMNVLHLFVGTIRGLALKYLHFLGDRYLAYVLLLLPHLYADNK